MDKATREQLWKDPDWTCPCCRFVNFAIRSHCRNCDYIGGELLIHDVAFLEVTGALTA